MLTPLQNRIFIAVDEWLGILVLFMLRDDPSFWWFAIPWAIAIYGISYPWHWYKSVKKKDEDR